MCLRNPSKVGWTSSLLRDCSQDIHVGSRASHSDRRPVVLSTTWPSVPSLPSHFPPWCCPPLPSIPAGLYPPPTRPIVFHRNSPPLKFSAPTTKSLPTFWNHLLTSTIKILIPRSVCFLLAMGMNEYIFEEKAPENTKTWICARALQTVWRTGNEGIWRLVMDRDLQIFFFSKEKLKQEKEGVRKGYGLLPSHPRHSSVNINHLPCTRNYRSYSHATKNRSHVPHT